MHNRTNKLIEFQHNDRLPHWIINIFLTYNGSKKKLSETYTKTAIVSTHPISHIVTSMSTLWSTLGSTFSAVSSFDGAFRFLFVLITCWSLIFPMLEKNRVINDPARRLLSVLNYIFPKFAGVFDMTFNTTREDDQDWTNKWQIVGLLWNLVYILFNILGLKLCERFSNFILALIL